MPTSPTFLMFDLETTGTRMNGQDHILEIGAIAVDDEYNELARYSSLVNIPMSLVMEALDNQIKPNSHGQPCSFVREMHTKNGLLRDLAMMENVILAEQGHRTHPAAAYSDASNDFTDWLQAQGYEPGKIIMVGHSIATFDYPFLKATMSRVFTWFSHRTEDYGAIGRYLRRMGANLPEKPKEEWPHRALGDCEIELAEAQLCNAITKNAFRTHNLLTLNEPLEYPKQVVDPFEFPRGPTATGGE